MGFCYVILKQGVEGDDGLKTELKQCVRKEVGPFAQPDHIIFTSALPKTRSGKIMRRILRKIAENDTSNLGDTSTLLDQASSMNSSRRPASSSTLHHVDRAI